MDSTEIFSERAKNYALYRPAYAEKALDWLFGQLDLPANALVADIGSGTGILTKQLAARGYSIYAVEPNEAMRRQAEVHCQDLVNVTSIGAPAEATTLAAGSIDLITAGQAFHWFDHEQVYVEFRRVLKLGGRVALLWNRPPPDPGPFGEAMGELMKRFELGHSAKRGPIKPKLEAFFGSEVNHATFNNHRLLSWEAFLGGFLSTSWAPRPPDVEYVAVVEALEKLFQDHAVNGRFQDSMVTELFVGTFSRNDQPKGG